MMRKVRFEFTAAELAEVAGWAVDRSPVIQKLRVKNRILWSFMLGLIAFAFWPAEMVMRVLIGVVVAGVVFAAIALAVRGRRGNPRLVEVYRERLGGDGPFPCEVEIDEHGIVNRQLGAEAKREWSHVVSVSEAPGGIEFVYRPMGGLLVRDRAFPDAQSRADFLADARGYLSASSTSH